MVYILQMERYMNQVCSSVIVLITLIVRSTQKVMCLMSKVHWKLDLETENKK